MILQKNKTVAIVVPSDATERERFAAEELQKYLQKIIGGIYPIVDDSAEYEECFLIGGPDRNRLTESCISCAEFAAQVPGPEGMYLRAFGDRIVLAGSHGHTTECERGTIYAVYEFLERYLGCSLSAYTKDGVPGGEFVPELETANLRCINYCKPRADVPFRAAVAQYEFETWNIGRDYALDLAFFDWLCKNRYNYIYTWNGVYEHFKNNGLLEEGIKRGIIFKVGHHDTIDTMLPQRGNAYFPEHYFETHPEYYKLNPDGSRFEMVDNWGQMVLCCRNEDMIAQFADNLNHWLSMNPQVKMYAIIPKDGIAPQCCCELCAPYTKTENYSHMINSIAKKVAAVHPDVQVVFSAYTDLWEPPTGMVLEPNVAVDEAVWHETGLRTIGKPDGSCLAGTFFEENLLKWKELGASVMFYDYFMGVYPGRQRYVPMADEMQAMCRRFVEKGIEGTETQIEVYNHWNNIFNFYTYGRTAYDISLSMDDNLARFTKIFGAGGASIADNIRYAESVLDGQNEIMTAGIYLMQHIDKQRMYDGFDRALEAAETPAARNNVRLMRMAFRYSDLETGEDSTKDEIGYRALKHYDIEGRGELLYMKKHFDTYDSRDGYGIMIPVEAEDNGFVPDRWYFFE